MGILCEWTSPVRCGPWKTSQTARHAEGACRESHSGPASAPLALGPRPALPPDLSFPQRPLMLISADVNTALNEQIGHEFAASVQYVAIAAHFECEGLPQLARHFYRQAVEERDHAMRFVKYIVDADGRVEIPAIPAPRARFASAEDAVQLS